MELPPQRRCPDARAAEATSADFLSLRVDGELGSGGIAEFLQNGLIIERLVLPPIEWAVLFMLVRAARSPDAEWSDTFLGAEKIVWKLGSLGLTGSTDPKVATKAVFRLRKKLSENRQLQRLSVDDAAREPLGLQLIETRRFMGYRITLAPEQIQIRERHQQGTSKESTLNRH